jgi:hypothetical protein
MGNNKPCILDVRFIDGGQYDKYGWSFFGYFLHVEDLLIAMGWLYNANNFLKI